MITANHTNTNIKHNAIDQLNIAMTMILMIKIMPLRQRGRATYLKKPICLIKSCSKHLNLWFFLYRNVRATAFHLYYWCFGRRQLIPSLTITSCFCGRTWKLRDEVPSWFPRCSHQIDSPIVLADATSNQHVVRLQHQIKVSNVALSWPQRISDLHWNSNLEVHVETNSHQTVVPSWVHAW